MTVEGKAEMLSALKNAVRPLLPSGILERYRDAVLVREARRLQRSAGSDPGSWVDALFGSPRFRPIQRRSEILGLVEKLAALEPRRICEIGAAGGGTTFLFSRTAREDGIVVSIDLAFPPARRWAVESWARPRQRLIGLSRDSHRPETLREIAELLGGLPLDFLLIDGDHSYEGVSRDFEMYSPLVRRGGLIAFHDSVPDHGSRFGIATPSSTGGVPRFWNEVKARFPHEEIVERPEQDGYGIGLVRWEG